MDEKLHGLPLVGALRTGPDPAPRIGEKEISKAADTLRKYKEGKANLEARIVEDEQWYKLRHWEALRRASQKGKRDAAAPEPSSAWLFNAILNKHADAMDNYPVPVVLPRERSDEQSAKTLSSVLPVILEYNDYDQTYSDNWWEKLKHGAAAYGVFWNSEKENGLGDVDIRQIDLLNLFWEPGVTDIQKSKNLFITTLCDREALEQEYPQYAGRLDGNGIDVKKYVYDDTVDTTEKAVVVDWYYKVRDGFGRTVLHYAKFCGNCLLYASENEPEYAERGFYDHGLYPVVLDVMFPEKGTPVGFGYVAICKDPQLYIDKLSANVLENAMMNTKVRFLVSESTAINEQDLLDWTRPLVPVAGGVDDARIKQIITQPLSSVYLEVMQMKIDEMKDTAANRDVNSGGTGSGVTAAAAIAALQEAGNKASRDMIAASYRAHVNISELVIELIRQFYDESRSFRITGEAGGNYDFVELSNAALKDQPLGVGADGAELFRKPVFDLKIAAQKKNPFSRMEENERAKELYNMGFFNPERAQEALGALEMMDFEGIDKVKAQVQQGQTLLNVCQQLMAQVQQLTAIITGTPAAVAQTPTGGSGGALTANGGQTTAQRMTDAVLQAHTPMTGYGERLAARSGPDMNAGGWEYDGNPRDEKGAAVYAYSKGPRHGQPGGVRRSVGDPFRAGGLSRE